MCLASVPAELGTIIDPPHGSSPVSEERQALSRDPAPSACANLLKRSARGESRYESTAVRLTISPSTVQLRLRPAHKPPVGIVDCRPASQPGSFVPSVCTALNILRPESQMRVPRALRHAVPLRKRGTSASDLNAKATGVPVLQRTASGTPSRKRDREPPRCAAPRNRCGDCSPGTRAESRFNVSAH
jgi:hypothetical protein